MLWIVLVMLAGTLFSINMLRMSQANPVKRHRQVKEANVRCYIELRSLSFYLFYYEFCVIY